MRTETSIDDSGDKTYALPNIESDSEQTGSTASCPDKCQIMKPILEQLER